jgi:hypothetical protein
MPPCLRQIASRFPDALRAGSLNLPTTTSTSTRLDTKLTLKTMRRRKRILGVKTVTDRPLPFTSKWQTRVGTCLIACLSLQGLRIQGVSHRPSSLTMSALRVLLAALEGQHAALLSQSTLALKHIRSITSVLQEAHVFPINLTAPLPLARSSLYGTWSAAELAGEEEETQPDTVRRLLANSSLKKLWQLFYKCVLGLEWAAFDVVVVVNLLFREFKNVQSWQPQTFRKSNAKESVPHTPLCLS